MAFLVCLGILFRVPVLSGDLTGTFRGKSQNCDVFWFTTRNAVAGSQVSVQAISLGYFWLFVWGDLDRLDSVHTGGTQFFSEVAAGI